MKRVYVFKKSSSILASMRMPKTTYVQLFIIRKTHWFHEAKVSKKESVLYN